MPQRLHGRGDAGGDGLDVLRVVVDGLAVEEPLAVSDGELQPAESRRAEVGVVDLGQRRLPQREVGVAAELVRCAEAVLVGGRPCVLRAGRAGSRFPGLGGSGDGERRADAEEGSRSRGAARTRLSRARNGYAPAPLA
jgi:hypothetical protein